MNLKTLSSCIITVSILCILPAFLFSQNPIEKGLNELSKDLIQAKLEFLSSDYLEGRELGTKGGYIAAEYIASLMKIYGLKPLYNSYFQEFNLVELNKNGNNSFELLQATKNDFKKFSFQDGVDFKIPIKDVSREIEAEIVFAGYGITDEKLGYDDYRGIDAKNKIVFILEGFPGHKNKASEAYQKFSDKYILRRYAQNYSKVKNAIAHGAIGIIQIAPKNYFKDWYSNKHYYNEEDLQHGQKPGKSFWDKKFVMHDETLNQELIEIYVSKRLANFLVNKPEFDYERFEQVAEKEMKPASFEIAQNKVHIKTSIQSNLIKCRNVCGIIKGKDTTQNIIISAHYDHYGMANNYIWNGADDNGSGTAGMLAIAKAYANMGKKTKHNLVFLAFDAEEKGLHGSNYFASHMHHNFKVNYIMNLDMISRNSKQDTLGNICYIIYSEDKGEIRANFENLVKDYNLNLDLTFYPSDGQSGGSDHASFARKGIPFSFFWSGWHEDYHNPGDEIQKINWDKMLELCKLGFLHICEIDKDALKY